MIFEYTTRDFHYWNFDKFEVNVRTGPSMTEFVVYLNETVAAIAYQNYKFSVSSNALPRTIGQYRYVKIKLQNQLG